MARAFRIGLVALTLVAGKAWAQFCPGLPPWVFSDVSSNHIFCSDITWLAERGVTLGCSVLDPNNRLYCPADFVRREQMAAFMHRLGDALFPQTCAPGQVMKWNGLEWTCANDNIGGSGGGGTVTSVAASTGLSATPNPIVGAGTLSVAPAYRLPQGCAANQVPRWNGSAWICAADAGSVTSVAAGAGITLSPSPITTTGTVAADTSYLQRRVTGTCAAGSSMRTINADGTVVCETDDGGGGASAWLVSGNSGTNPATQFVGTTDDEALVVRVNNLRALRIEPSPISPNLIGGNPSNAVSDGVRGATIGGGGVAPGATDPDYEFEAPNVVTDAYGTVSGGYANRAGNNAGTVVDRPFATVSGGAFNIAGGVYATVSGGGGNQAQDNYAAVSGGEGNQALAPHSSVGGGVQNFAKSFWSRVGGGQGNSAGSTPASGVASVVGGGMLNTATGNRSAIGGGEENNATGEGSSIGGGSGNNALGPSSTIGGGTSNVASGGTSTVAGGFLNVAEGGAGAIGGGQLNFATGIFSTVPGGFRNSAIGDYSVAMGHRAIVNGTGSFLYADASENTPVTTNTANEFVAVATGGVAFSTTRDFTNVCRLAAGGGSWACVSDRNVKQDFAAVDVTAILDGVLALPLSTWRFRTQPADVRHLGPMAQDFRATFGLGGNDERTITQVDVNGVVLAAIQGLHRQMEDRDAALRARLADKDREIESLRHDLAAIKAKLGLD